MKCRYIKICPAYSAWSEKCNQDSVLGRGDLKCIPLLLEAYHKEKGTPYKEISKYLD